MDQLLGQQDPAGLGHRHRRGAQMLAEQSPKLSLAHPQPTGKTVHIAIIQGALLDQGHGPGHGVGGAVPGAQVRRGLRAAAQAGPEASLLGRRSRGIEGYVPAFGGPRRTDRSAVDPRRAHSAEDPSVKAGVAHREGAVAGVVIQFHARTIAPPRREVSRFSDIAVVSLEIRLTCAGPRLWGSAAGRRRPGPCQRPPAPFP